MKKTVVKKIKPVRPKFSLIPRSTAENAYQLLDEVVAAIREEPERLDMGAWSRTPKEVGAMGDNAPACGTVGCMAGWITFIADRKVRSNNDGTIANRAISLLGAEGWSDTERVRVQLFANSGTELAGTKPGTKAHADAVIRRIRAYQRANNAHLIETPVETR